MSIPSFSRRSFVWTWCLDEGPCPQVLYNLVAQGLQGSCFIFQVWSSPFALSLALHSPVCGVCFLISVLCLEAVQSEVGFVFSMLADGPLAPGRKKSTLYTIQYAFNPNGSEQESTKTLCLARYPSLSHVKKHIASATLFLSATLTNISSPLLFSTSPCLCKTIWSTVSLDMYGHGMQPNYSIFLYLEFLSACNNTL